MIVLSGPLGFDQTTPWVLSVAAFAMKHYGMDVRFLPRGQPNLAALGEWSSRISSVDALVRKYNRITHIVEFGDWAEAGLLQAAIKIQRDRIRCIYVTAGLPHSQKTAARLQAATDYIVCTEETELRAFNAIKEDKSAELRWLPCHDWVGAEIQARPIRETEDDHNGIVVIPLDCRSFHEVCPWLFSAGYSLMKYNHDLQILVLHEPSLRGTYAQGARQMVRAFGSRFRAERCISLTRYLDAVDSARFVWLPQPRAGTAWFAYAAKRRGCPVLAWNLPSYRNLITTKRHGRLIPCETIRFWNGTLSAIFDTSSLQSGLDRIFVDEPVREKMTQGTPSLGLFKSVWSELLTVRTEHDGKGTRT